MRHQRRARVGEGLFQGEGAVGGLGILFLPKLLCPGDPRAVSHPGQEQLLRTPGADTEQGPALGVVFPTAQGTLPKKSQDLGKTKGRRSFQVCGWPSVYAEASQSLEVSSKPSQSSDAFPRSPQGLLRVLSSLLEVFSRFPQGFLKISSRSP